MLNYLLSNMNDIFEYNIFYAVTFRSAAAFFSSLIICFLIGPKIIRKLQVLQIGEVIHSDGPASHQKKQGTPTMGGIIIIVAIILPTFLWADLENNFIMIVLLSTFWMGAIGFIDDYLKVVKNFSKGLIARYKIISQIILGVIIAGMIYVWVEMPLIFHDNIDGSNTEELISLESISLPFLSNGYLELNTIFYVMLIVLVITASSNAVNLTDGLDGLAIGLLAISLLSFAGIAYASGRTDFSDYLNIIYIKDASELTIYCMSGVGACLGFLWFNSNPAAVFMGDTGSLSLGASLGVLSILLKKEILLILIGGLFVAEALSVIMQVSYFKYTRYRYGTGRKLLLMAPLHHHFELKGWEENHIVIRFWIIGIVLALLSLTTFKIQ